MIIQQTNNRKNKSNKKRNKIIKKKNKNNFFEVFSRFLNTWGM